MLTIRLQRTGRKGHAQFRMVVQESRRSPKSGNIVLSLGNYDPHTKVASIDKEKAAYYLTNGAQPSSRVAVLLQKEGITLPSWVKVESTKQATIRNADKRRSTRPVEEVEEEAPVAEEAPAEAEVAAEEAPATEEAAPAEAEVATEETTKA